MTGPREAGVLLGQARGRDERKRSSRDESVLALERIAQALEGLEVAFAVIADVVEAQAYEMESEASEADLDDTEIAEMGHA